VSLENFVKHISRGSATRKTNASRLIDFVWIAHAFFLIELKIASSAAVGGRVVLASALIFSSAGSGSFLLGTVILTMSAGFGLTTQSALNACQPRTTHSSKAFSKVHPALFASLAMASMASVEFTPAARLAVYRLGDFGAEKVTPESLDQTALHELLHVFLHDLMTVAQDPKSSQDEIEMQEHRVINLLEKLLFKDSNGRT